jgi:hypothetical protein
VTDTYTGNPYQAPSWDKDVAPHSSTERRKLPLVRSPLAPRQKGTRVGRFRRCVRRSRKEINRNQRGIRQHCFRKPGHQFPSRPLEFSANAGHYRPLAPSKAIVPAMHSIPPILPEEIGATCLI